LCPNKASNQEDDDLSRQRLEQLLESLNADISLLGYMIINQSGGVMLADLPSDIDGELISFRFLALIKNCNATLSEFKKGTLKGISFQTENTLITGFELSESWLIMLGPLDSRPSQLKLFGQSEIAPLPQVVTMGC